MGTETKPAQMMKPTVGRMVHYSISPFDVESIQRKREAVGELHHIGNHVEAGQVYPMVIVRTWGDETTSAVNGQVLLDGSDVYWATSKQQVVADASEKQGFWFAPPRA